MAFDVLGSVETALRLLAGLPLGCMVWVLFLSTPAGITFAEHQE
jgi:hypothetical protein